MMKTCSKCKRELSLDNFSADKKGKDGSSSQCKDCRNDYFKNHYERGKHNVDTYKTHCAKCGCGTHYVLTFHHIDYRTKSFEISGARRKISDIVNEIKKCICLCYNCHHTYHYFYGNQPTSPVESLHEFLQDDWTPNLKLKETQYN